VTLLQPLSFFPVTDKSVFRNVTFRQFPVTENPVSQELASLAGIPNNQIAVIKPRNNSATRNGR
jgi:hypothetical protein